MSVNSATVRDVWAEFDTPGARADPYPLYARLRELGPAVQVPDGPLLVTGYQACAGLLRDHRLHKDPERRLIASGHRDWRQRPSLRMMFTSLLVRNPPDHTRLRRLLSHAFTPRRVEALRPAVARIITELCERTAGENDFITAFAHPLPFTVIAELLGIPTAERKMFQTLVLHWTMVLDDLSAPVVERADAAALVIRDYLADLAAQRRARPGDDLISSLAAATDTTAELDAEELVTTAALLLAAGVETTTGLLANGLLALLDHPDQADRLRADPGLAASAVEELLRYDSPVQILSTRTAPHELTVSDLTLTAGQPVVALLGAANRDPSVFTRADRLLLDRAERPPLSFGGGIHYCLGAPLARLEAQLALPALLSRFPRLALSGTPTPREGLALHGYTSLPVCAH